ncbi:MAG TPA: helix-turn-helix transcriptional regulator [Modicisalibacter sp.]|nr:helix-turn-helix transcriptional regulator [Modicisalibacter sp.]
MTDEQFTVSSAEWAKRVFPARFKEVAKKRHGYKEGESESKLNKKVSDLLNTKTKASKATVSRWMSGKAFPRIESILIIADLYDSDPGYLVGNNDADEAGFSLAAIEARIPYEKVMQVLRIMSEIRGSDGMSNEHFADAGVRMLQMVEREPGMSEDAITGAAYRMLRSSSIKDPKDG